MNNSIQNVLETILSDTKTSNTLTEMVKELSSHKDEISTKTDNLKGNEKIQKIQKKIDIITALLPLLGEKNTEQAKFIIKILTITKLIHELDES